MVLVIADGTYGIKHHHLVFFGGYHRIPYVPSYSVHN